MQKSTEKLLGSMVIGIQDYALTKIEQSILNEYPDNIGGIILFSHNFQNKSQLVKLVTSIRNINPNWVIMVDHEGGSVWRFKSSDFPNPGAMQDLGKLYDKDPLAALELAYNRGQTIAKDLIAVDIDLNLAPVIDLDHNGISSVIANRAIHSNPNVVAILAAKFIQGQASMGMQSVAKHFPGHGSISADTHLIQGSDPRSRSTIFSQDLLPFIKLIHGDPELNINPATLAGIMPAHIIYPDIDPINPAGFSKIWLQTILREQLKFTGVIISDCLSMRAAQAFWDKHRSATAFTPNPDLDEYSSQQHKNLELIQYAVAAGCDLVIFNQIYAQELKQLLSKIAALNLGTSEECSQRSLRIKQLLRKSQQ